jgi:hypothetical protein
MVLSFMVHVITIFSNFSWLVMQYFSDRDKVLSILVHSFQHMMTLGTKKPTLQCVQWLHEITGHCRNIAMGTFKLTAEDADISKVFD